jgi:hypothetical protein
VIWRRSVQAVDLSNKLLGGAAELVFEFSDGPIGRENVRVDGGGVVARLTRSDGAVNGV